MTLVMGVNLMADTSACIVRDGKLMNYVEAERFTRVKHNRRYDQKNDRVELFSPIPAIKWCLKDANVDISDVDVIAIPWRAPKEEMKNVYSAVPCYKPPEKEAWEERCLANHNPDALTGKLKKELEDNELTPVPEIVCVPHHRSHAASCAFTSGWNDCAVLTCDGHGDTTSTAGWWKNGLELKRLFSAPLWNSLGWFYSAMVEFVGMRMRHDETKLMNLANYGKSSPVLRKKMDKLVSTKGDFYESDPSYFLYGSHQVSKNPRYSDKLINLLGKDYSNAQANFRTIEDAKNSGIANIAEAVQLKLEEALLKLANKLWEMTGSKYLAMSGGIALNCRANARILRDSPFENVFCVPPSHDGSTAIGAAFTQYIKETGKDPTFTLQHAFYGPEYSNKEIEEFLESQELEFYEVEPVAKAVELLKDNEIVGWFQGRRECGPRALMNSSILFDCRDRRNFYRVNRRKKSVEWRERSPSLTPRFAEEHFDKYNSKLDPFMLSLRKVNKDVMPAVTSIRGETRPQVVEYPLLELMEEEEGYGALGNTSFNQSGKAIVNSPYHVIEDAKAMKLEHVIIGDFYVSL